MFGGFIIGAFAYGDFIFDGTIVARLWTNLINNTKNVSWLSKDNVITRNWTDLITEKINTSFSDNNMYVANDFQNTINNSEVLWVDKNSFSEEVYSNKNNKVPSLFSTKNIELSGDWEDEFEINKNASFENKNNEKEISYTNETNTNPNIKWYNR